jgi:hypothetical protein
MSERGVFAVDRGIFDHSVFAREPFTQREAWIWLIAEAAYKPRTKRSDGKVISLQRGQLCHSIRFMADAWQWSKSRVDRFLDLLANQDMIRRDTGTRTPILTICNYDEYQRVALPSRDNSGTTGGTTPGQERDKLEDRENIKLGGGDERAQRSREIVAKCQEAAGDSLHPTGAAAMGVISDVLGWLDNGADLDEDVVPALRAAAARMRPGSLHSFAIVRERVAESVERRKRGLPVVDLVQPRAPPARARNTRSLIDGLDEIERRFSDVPPAYPRLAG